MNQRLQKPIVKLRIKRERASDKMAIGIVKLSTKRCVHALNLVRLVSKGVNLMSPKQATELGSLLRQRRKGLGISTLRLAKLVGTRQSTITRLELGQFTSPQPDKLARIAKTLGLDRVEVYARAGYVMADELPSLEPYLFIKYPYLSEDAITALTRRFKNWADDEDVTTK